jgi:hypothetical protein
MKFAHCSIQLLFVLSVVLTTARAQGISGIDSCSSTANITVQYILWVGTDIDLSFTTEVSVRQYSTFYDVMQAAAEQEPTTYG